MLRIFSILDLPQDTEINNVKKAYRNAVKIVHPDKGGNPQVFRNLQTAYQEYMLFIGETNEEAIALNTIIEVFSVCIGQKMLPGIIMSWLKDFFISQQEVLRKEIVKVEQEDGYYTAMYQALSLVLNQEFKEKIAGFALTAKSAECQDTIFTHNFTIRIYNLCVRMLEANTCKALL